MGNVQIGRGGLGLGPGKPVWSRASPKEKRKLVVEQVHRQEEMLRGAKAKQGRWFNWEAVEKKKLSWKELWSLEESSVRFCNFKAHLSGCKVSLSQGRYTWRHN